MHVTLLRPPKIASLKAPNTHTAVPPLGLAYLSAFVKTRGHRVTILDAYGEEPSRITPLSDPRLVAVGLTADDLVERIPRDTECIGVSMMFSMEWFYYRELVGKIRNAFPHIPLLAGGEHATAIPEYVLAHSPVDVVVMGEGEETLAELLQCYEKGGDLKAIAGIAYKKRDGEIIRNPRRARIRALDELPWPDWENTPIETYLDRRFGYDEIVRRSMPMLASRGCPYQCTFCSNPAMWGTRWWARDVGKLIEEIRFYMHRYRITHVEFYDLTAIVDRRWILAFSRALMEQGLNLTWSLPSGTRSEALDREVLHFMKLSGCRRVVYAPESGSPETLERIKKKVKPERMLASVRAAVQEGLHTRAHFIMGLPDQSLREVLQSLWFMLRLAWAGLHDVSIFRFFPYPGSELFLRLEKEGLIPRDPEGFEAFLQEACFTDFSRVRSYSREMGRLSLLLFCLGGMALFYLVSFLLRPWRPFEVFLRTFVKKEPSTWLDRYLVALYRRMFRKELYPGALLKPMVRKAA